MSIYDAIVERSKEGRLYRLLPVLPRLGPTRQLYAAPEIMGLLEGPWQSLAWEMRCNALRADLERFTDGQDMLPIAAKPFKGKTSYLKRLDPPRREVWEIRSLDPKPGIRVLGRFASKDVFVALAWYERAPLLGPGSREWRDAVIDCKTKWDNLFGPYQPISEASFHDYLSNIFLV